MVWKCGSFEFDLSTPLIMGVLNVTPDSFSDGGKHDDLESAVAHARELVAAGAAIIDVGGESTRPGSEEVSTAEERERVVPVVKALASEGIAVSVDTRHADVAQAALEAGACIVNDVSGMRDAAMREVVAASDCGVVIMHMLGEPGTMQKDPRYDDVVAEIEEYLLAQAAQLEALGVVQERICLDPGPGFGKTRAHNQALMEATPRLSGLGYAYMIAVSRKSYIGACTGIEAPDQRDEASALCAAAAVAHGAHVVRAHDVACTARALSDSRRAYIALGSNIPAEHASETGEPDGRVTQLDDAIASLARVPGVWVWAVSSYYETEPAYYEPQALFANAVAELRTTLGPYELLDVLHQVENAQGRVRSIPNGPRTLDLDVLDYEGVVSDDPVLTLPHPRILERDFVVTPLLELDAQAVLADGVKVVRDGIVYGKVVDKLR